MSEVPSTSQSKDAASRPRYTLRTLLLAFVPVCGLLAAYHWVGVALFPVLFFLAIIAFAIWGWFLAPRGQGWWVVSSLPIFFVYCLLPNLGPHPVPSMRSACTNNLKNIGLALHNYEAVYGSFPLRTNAKQAGSGLSWRVAILPLIEEQPLFNAFRQDEPWDSPANRPLANRRSEVYHCPADKTAGPTQTNYYAVGGDDTCWPDDRAITFADIKDGSSNTLLVVESHDIGAVWSEPRDLEADKLAPSQAGKARQWISSRHQRDDSPVYIDEAFGFRQKEPVTCGNVALADGSIRFLSRDVDPEVVRQLANRRDGQPKGNWDP